MSYMCQSSLIRVTCYDESQTVEAYEIFYADKCYMTCMIELDLNLSYCVNMWWVVVCGKVHISVQI